MWYARQPRWLRAAIAIGGSLTAIGLAMVALASYELSSKRMCGSHGARELISPDGAYRAVLYEYDCGATTDFGTNLAVQKQSRKFDPLAVDPSEHVLVADSNHQAAGVDRDGILAVTVRWMDGWQPSGGFGSSGRQDFSTENVERPGLNRLRRSMRQPRFCSRSLVWRSVQNIDGNLGAVSVI
jgi:hypothetical protein